jgi:hypothetical protein
MPRELERMGGFATGIPVLIVLTGTVFIGGLSVLIAWIHVISGSFRGEPVSVPSSLYLLSVAVLVDLLALLSLDTTPANALFFLSTWGWPLLMFTSGALVTASTFLARKASFPARKPVYGSALILLAINLFGLVLYVLALPGMPLG